MYPLKILAALALVLSILIACNGSAPVSLSEKDAGKSMELKQGDILIITLEGNPTTGYTWMMQPVDHPLLEQVGEPQVTPASDLLGAPGVMALRFKAVQPGQANLKLVYARPWEADTPPEKTFEVSLTVR